MFPSCVSWRAIVGPNVLAVIAFFRIDFVVTEFFEAVMAIAVAPPDTATIRARVATVLA